MMADKNGEMKTPGAGRGSGVTTGSGNAVAGPSPNTSARLPSLRAPRDLTLSASSSAPTVKVSLMSRPRKNFSPNIPMRREKTDKIQESHSEAKGPKRTHERDKKEGGRGRGRGNKEFIQTTGALFGDGIAAVSRRGFAGGRGGGRGGGGAGRGSDTGFINKPVLNLDTVNHIDKDHEDQRLKEILRDDFIDDLDDGLRRDDGDLLPVQLPMVDTGRGFKEEDHGESKASVDTKNPDIPSLVAENSDLEIKKEPEDNLSTSEHDMKDIAEETKDMKLADSKIPMKGCLPTKERPPELSVAQLLTRGHEEFMFFQLPNSLPSLPPEIKQEPNSSKTQPQASSNTASDDEEDKEKNTKTDYCTLNTLQEGLIATCKIYKSGKTELWFGEHRLSVNKGTQVGFLQDVVSMDIDEETKTGAMSVLGHIGHRLVCSPDLEALVKRKTS